LLDARGGCVEALGDAGDLVPTLDLHPDSQVACTQGFHALLKAFKATGQSAHDRKGSDRKHEPDHGQMCQKARTAHLPLPRRADDDLAAIAQGEFPDGVAGSGPWTVFVDLARRWQGRARRADEAACAIVDGKVGLKQSREATDRGLLDIRRRIRVASSGPVDQMATDTSNARSSVATTVA
jgi:hypothetical protein